MNEPKMFPTLYKKSGAGKLQQWNVSVAEESEFPTIVTEHGQVGGKLQTARETVREGKNIGRSNETSAWDQAVSEAESKWTLQKTKKGYVDTMDAAQAGEVDALVEGGIFPMLAQKFEKRSKDVEYPAYIQPKFDGHRCIAVMKDGICTLWSRTRKPINSMPHICRAVERLTGGADAILDGELYNHEYHDHFEKITKLIRPNAPVEGHEKVKYYIYDMPSAPFKYADRWRTINKVFDLAGDNVPELVNVETCVVENEAEVTLAFDRFFSQKYEGAIFRAADNVYLQHPTSRSPGLLKLKHFDDAEFEIVDVEQGSGKFEGLAIFICLAGNGKTFKAVKNGSLEELRDYYEHRDQLIGRIVTVKFMGFTKAEGVPRHGRALRFREDL